jgi:hypothetical protein
MTRCFYPANRAHHAYVMAIDFGMKFKKRNGFWSPEGLLGITGAGGYRIEVAEESLSLLEPEMGDWILQRRVMPHTGIDYVRMLQWSSECLMDGVRLLATDHIVLRGRKPFHWPEFEL